MNHKFNISELDIEKLDEVLTLVWKVFLEFEAPDYDQEGIQEFKQFIEYSSIKQKLLDNQFKIWTYSENDKIVGVIAVRPVCHISLLFVDGAHHRKGVARAMFEKVTDFYKNENTEMTVNSSPYAVEVYHKLGFVDTNAEQTVNGIRFIPMKCTK